MSGLACVVMKSPSITLGPVVVSIMLGPVVEAFKLGSIEVHVWALRPTGIVTLLIPSWTPTKRKVSRFCVVCRGNYIVSCSVQSMQIGVMADQQVV